MTDKTNLIREIHEYVTTHGGVNTTTHLLVQAASVIQTQAAELEAVGAGGVQALCAAPAGVAPTAPTPQHIVAMERAWLWMDNQADQQSKGGHATFDLMMLRKERDALREAIDGSQDTSCEHCHGSGEVLLHTDDCYDELCALNGDQHSCAGKVEDCQCAASQPPISNTLWRMLTGGYEHTYILQLPNDSRDRRELIDRACHNWRRICAEIGNSAVASAVSPQTAQAPQQAAPKAAPVTQQAGYAEVIECGNSYAKVKLKGEAFGSTRVGDIFYTAPQPSPTAKAASAARDSLENLLELIDNYAETRHTCGHWTYNLKSNEARQKVITALKGE